MNGDDPARDLLERIRAALGRGERPASAGEAHPGALAPDEADAAAAFAANFEEAGGLCLRGPAIEPLLPALAEALRAESVTALVAAEGDAAAHAVALGAAPFGPFAIVPAAEVRRAAPPDSAGIQSAEYAIAETGTIVQTSRGGKSLAPGLLTDVHVALIAPGRIVNRMEECLDELAADPPRNISFITGPSKTADIEQTLTVGAHGPRKVVAFILPEE